MALQMLNSTEKNRRPRHLPLLNLPSPDSFSNPHIRLTSEQATHFDTAFSAVVAQGHVGVLAEGAPFNAVLSKEAVEKLQRLTAGSADGIALNSLVAAIADAFDYDSARIDEHTILLYKRFTDPADLPFVTYDEAVHDFRGTLRVMAPYNPPVIYPNNPSNPLIPFLVAANDHFGAERLKQGVPLSAFSFEQQQLLLKYADFSFSSDGASRISLVLDTMSGMDSPTACFRRMNLLESGVLVFGFEGPFGPLQHQNEYALSHGFRIQSGGTSATATKRGMTLTLGVITTYPGVKLDAVSKKRIVNELRDSGAPTPEDLIPPTAFPQTCTLEEFAKRSTSRNTKQGIQFDTDSAINPKTITVFGEQNIPPEVAMQAAARLYGLYLQHQTEKEWFLTIPPSRTARSPAEMLDSVEALIPEPWRRAFLNGAVREEHLLMAEEEQKAMTAGKEFDSFVLTRIRLYNAPEHSADAIYRAAIHRLRVLVEPKIDKSPEGRYPMSSMTEEERRLFLLIWATETLKPLDDFIRSKAPVCLTDTSQMVVRGVIDFLPTQSLVSMGYKNAQGKYIGEEGARIERPSVNQTPHEAPAPSP